MFPRRPIPISLLAAGSLLQSGASRCGAEALPSAELRPFFSDYCFRCHSDERQKADLNLQAHLTGEGLAAPDRDVWAAVLDVLVEREMPPENKPQPAPAERDELVAKLEAELERIDRESGDDPGRVTVRRLNRDEYNNTVRDLLGVEFRPADDFPRDEVGYGFDNIGDVLSMSPVLFEKYLGAAGQIAAETVRTDIPEWPPVRRYEAERMRDFNGNDIRPLDSGWLGFYREGAAIAEYEAPQTGRYQFELRVYQDRAGPEDVVMALEVDGDERHRRDVIGQVNKPDLIRFEADLEEGKRRIEIVYTNNWVNSNHPDPALRGDRNMFVDYLEVKGPLGAERPPLPELHRRVIPQQPKQGEEMVAARELLANLAGRAFRRPASEEEVERLARLVQLVMRDGGSFEAGMQLALEAILVSPHFLFRWEFDPQQLEPEIGVRELGQYEIASRLSYFLWSSMPDEALFAAAREGELTDPVRLWAQAERMLADPKADALIENFAGQWLQIRNLENVAPDPELFPDFDAALRAAMRRETELFFAAIVREERSVLELLDADFTFLNERLARHYGIENVAGEAFQRVALRPEHRRGGVLTHAGVLTLTSNPTRTSPVLRGKWVLEQILGTPPPEPPADVPELEETQEARESASLRERLEIHRDKPECAGCHAKMDPIGFALENFDAIGRWRDLEGTFPIDASGALPSGEAFTGASDLMAILKNRDEFVNTLSMKMLTYALGRGTEYYDRGAIESIAAQVDAEGHRFSALIRAIVLSEPFLKRRIGGEK